MDNDNASKRILLIEDEEISMRIMLKFLTQNGFEVISAISGLEAIEIFEKEEVSLVLMDIRMPEMDGYTAAGIMRDNEKNTGKHTPIIAVTACAVKGDREKCINAGMDDYITKPVDLRKLLDIINTYINK